MARPSFSDAAKIASARAETAEPIVARKARPIEAVPEPAPVTPVAEPVARGGATSRPVVYENYERTEARLSPEVTDRLNALARRLHRERTDKNAPRVTRNTLLRVAAEYLLDAANDITGDDEAQMLASLRKSR